MSFDTPSESFCTFFTCRSPKISQQNLSGVWKVSHPCLIENGCKNLRVLLSLQSGAKNCPFLVILRGNVSANIFRRNKATTEEWKTEWTDIANYEGSATLSHKGWSSHRNCSYIAIYPVLFVFCLYCCRIWQTRILVQKTYSRRQLLCRRWTHPRHEDSYDCPSHCADTRQVTTRNRRTPHHPARYDRCQVRSGSSTLYQRTFNSTFSINSILENLNVQCLCMVKCHQSQH